MYIIISKTNKTQNIQIYQKITVFVINNRCFMTNLVDNLVLGFRINLKEDFANILIILKVRNKDKYSFDGAETLENAS